MEYVQSRKREAIAKTIADAIFSPLLWGNPASHFGTENDAVYVALVRFKRTLMWAGPTTRSLTHTMHFPPAQAEIYDGPRSPWLFDILRRLPYLQSLVVSNLPFFDYGALSALVKSSQPDPKDGLAPATYQLRLLDASHCNNLTPQTLSAALQLFPGLVYLDLSGTTSARYREVLASFASLTALQVLKIQCLWLTDDDLAYLIAVVGRRLRSLDIRHNRITDRGVKNLIQDAICVNGSGLPGHRGLHQLSTKIRRILESEAQEDYVRHRLMNGFVSDLGIEIWAGKGITHLYASGNEITAAGASGLIRCKQLRVLDLGNVMDTRVQAHHPKYELPPEVVRLPKAQILIPQIEDSDKSLTYLRVNHAVVTELSQVKIARAVEIEDTSALVMPSNVAELDAVGDSTPELHSTDINELPDNAISEAPGTIPFYAELEGSPVAQHVEIRRVGPRSLPAQGHHVGITNAKHTESAVSPILDASGGLFSPVSPLSPQHPHRMEQRSENGLLAVPDTSLPILAPADGLEVVEHTEEPSQAPRSRRSYSGVLDEHEARTRYHQSEDHNLLPATLGEIRTLILTDVPAKSSSENTANNIIRFIKGCAEEERWAAMQASVGYQLPPGPDRRNAEKQYAQSLFPFRKLVLEMASPQTQKAAAAKNWRRSNGVAANTLSSTLDPDCEAYLEAGKDDFSFFDSEECGQPDAEAKPPLPFAAFHEKLAIDPSPSYRRNSIQNGGGASEHPTHDVLAAISQFRREKKAEYERASTTGVDHVEGYWSGIIEVVRPR